MVANVVAYVLVRFGGFLPLTPAGASHRRERFAHWPWRGLGHWMLLCWRSSLTSPSVLPSPGVSCRMRSLDVWRGGLCCRLQKCPGGNASSVIRWLFSSFKKDFSTRIVVETTLGLFMDHKDYGGTNFAITFFFLSLKIMDLLYVVNLQFVWRGPNSEVETDFF